MRCGLPLGNLSRRGEIPGSSLNEAFQYFRSLIRTQDIDDL
jgi:hypothetical protein